MLYGHRIYVWLHQQNIILRVLHICGFQFQLTKIILNRKDELK